jgi:hypothetical protein
MSPVLSVHGRLFFLTLGVGELRLRPHGGVPFAVALHMFCPDVVNYTKHRGLSPLPVSVAEVDFLRQELAAADARYAQLLVATQDASMFYSS